VDLPLSLDEAQRADVMACYLGARDVPARKRCHVLLLLDDGLSVDRVAKAIDATVEEVNYCVSRFLAGGVDAVLRAE
jgi:hypothetical protein